MKTGDRVIVIHSASELEKRLEEASTTSRLAILFFSKARPCRFISPLYASLALKSPKVVFLKVHIEEGPNAESMALVRGIRKFPTFLFYKSGEEVDKSTGSADAAIDILVDGITNVPNCKLLLKELINFTMMHERPRHINVVESIIVNAISQGLDAKDAEDISSLYLEGKEPAHKIVFPHSLRTASSKHPTIDAKALKLAKEVREDTFDSSSGFLIQLPLEDNKMSPTENPDTRAPTNISEERPPSLDNNDNQFESVTTDQLQSSEADNSLQERLEQESPKVFEWPRGNSPKPNVPLVQGEQLSLKVL
ncbi:hypothetical protein FH972_001011 [Carpinus fangiana]|uniref:Thioredoxin domain-containing protein n=1 Tax=Carpinus fangiana TaxID=176857 RepID=A0A5N6QAL8_9ROSI|nr:hypothetical protein FH972_001011 [Carpinus fangiana]